MQSPFLLLIRVYWGWQFAQTGWGKLHNLPHVIEFFTSLGLPAPGPTAVFVSVFELTEEFCWRWGFFRGSRRWGL